MIKGLKFTNRRILFAVLIAVVGFGFLLGFMIRGCGAETRFSAEIEKEPETEALPIGFIVKGMNGVDLSDLSDEKRLLAIDVLNSVPCLSSAGGMSVARCRRDVPSCVTSQRMADFILDKVAKGSSKEEIFIALYDKALRERRVLPKLDNIPAKFSGEGLPFLGSADAPVEVALFYDYEGAISRKALESASLLLENYPGKVKITYCPYPLTKIRANAKKAARIAIAAGNLGCFGKAHDLLMENDGKSDDEKISLYSEKVDLPDLADEANSSKVARQISELEKTIGELGIMLPPVFYVQGRIVTGVVPGLCFLEDIVQQALLKNVRSEYKQLEERIAPLDGYGL